MSTKHKYILAILVVMVVVLYVIGSCYRKQRDSFDERLASTFSQILKLLSEDPNYIVRSNHRPHWGFSSTHDPNRLGGLNPNDPIPDDIVLCPLHVSLAILYMKKPTIFGRLLPSRRIPTGHWLNPSWVEKTDKIIMVAVSNPMKEEMQTLSKKVNGLKIDSDIYIKYYMENWKTRDSQEWRSVMKN
jgi:hypothetical protein